MIKIRELTKSYGSHIVLDHLNYEIQDGQKVYITGPSGCGKTTFLNILMGLETSEGTITGLNNKRMAAVFQEDRLCENLSASRNIRLPLGKLTSTQKNTETDRIQKDMAEIGLSGCMDMTVNQMSGGMKRRVSILRALHAQSDIIFFDEPLRGLDINNREVTLKKIQEYIQGKTVFWVTHDEQDKKDIPWDIHIEL
ncbi:MAG: ATP-binding cassette domain-containing protein [Erysipelotrichaceae bacterium]|nr:ATP-binding cassette domain-containing protein [Erysipelotrichaceae bacterium]